MPKANKIDTSEGGLLVTAPVLDKGVLPTPDQELVERPRPFEFEPVEDEPQAFDDHHDVEVSAGVSSDPNATVASVLIAIGRLYEDGSAVSTALSKHIPAVAAEPELHAFLQRMQVAIGDFRHTVEQIENGMSDSLREAIQQGVS